MKEKRYVIILLLVFAGSAVNGIAQKSADKIKSEKAENFKYLFSEALKQKIFGKYGNAVKYFLECEKIKPDDAVEYQLSGLFAMAGDEKHAVEYGRKAIKNAPENIWYYYQLASIYQMYGMKDSLLAVYARLTERFPGLKKEKLNYADMLVNTGNPAKALEIYEELEKEFGKNREIMQKEAVALLQEGKKEKASRKIEEALKIFGSDKSLYLIRASIMLENGKEKEAENIYRELMDNYPDDSEVEKKVYEYYVNNGQYDDALNVLKKITEDETVDPQQKIKYLFDLTGKINETDTIAQKKVEKILNDLYAQYNKDIRTSLLLIDHYARNEQYEKAKEILRNILTEYPEYGIGWRQMLYVCDQAGDQDSVIYYGKKARELFPKDPLYDVYIGYAWLQKGNNDKAKEFAKEGIRKVNRRGVDYVDKETGFDYRSFQKQFYALLGEVYKNIGDYKKSDEAFDAGLKLDPEDDMLLNNYSYYLSLRKEKLKKAQRMSYKTVKRNPENATFLDTYGWILFQMGKVREAEKYIRKALENGGDSSPEILKHYGDILLETGNSSEAVKYWRKALEKGGEKTELEEKINKYRK